MKNFIELPQKEGNILVNVSTILMVEPINFKDNQCTKISLSVIASTSIEDIPNNTPPSKTTYCKPLTVRVTLPYADVLKLIEAAL